MNIILDTLLNDNVLSGILWRFVTFIIAVVDFNSIIAVFCSRTTVVFTVPHAEFGSAAFNSCRGR
jgi:hypothetical protein